MPFKQWQGINRNFRTGFLALDKARTFRERHYEFDQDDIGYDGQPNTFFAAEKVGLIIRFGSYSVAVDASDLSAGAYFYRLRTGDKVLNRKMTLLK